MELWSKASITMTINRNKVYLVMKTKNFLSLLFLLCTPFFLCAQQWEKFFPERGFYSADQSVVKTDDGNYLLFGHYSNEDTNWKFRPLILKINSLGEVIWQKDFSHYDNNLSVDLPHLIKNIDDSFLLSLRKQSSNIPGYNQRKSSLVKIDANGSTIWEYDLLPIDGLDNRIQFMRINDDGTCGFILRSGVSGTYSQYVGKISADGNIIFLNEIDLPWINSKVLDNKNGGYFLRENTSAPDSLQFIEINEEGIILNNYLYPDISRIGQFEFLENGEFFHAENLDIPGKAVLQSRFELNGNLVFSDTLWRGLEIGFSSFTLENDFVFYTGTHLNLADNFEFGNVAVMKSHIDGNAIWNKIYDLRPSSQLGLNVIPAHGSGILVTSQNIDVTAHDWNLRLYALKLDDFGNLYSNTLSGNVAIDSALNCAIDSNDTIVSNWLITASKNDQVLATNTDDFGFYSMGLDTGTYTITLSHPTSNPYWEACNNNVEITFSDTLNTAALDFPITDLVDCPYMTVSYSMWALRPCLPVNSSLRYCNNGTAVAQDVSVEITFDDAIGLQSSSIPWSGQTGNTYTFDIGQVAPLECGTIQIDVLLECDAMLGQTFCIDTHIYPDSLCLAASPGWSGAFLEVSGSCENDSVYFNIENIGDSPMDAPSDYIIVEDAILLRLDSTQLPSGGNLNIPLPLNGSTYIVWAEQVPNAPGNSNPIAVVEGCGENGDGGISTGFYNQFPLNDGNHFEDTECIVATGSFDPNDKVGIPIGYGTERKILPNTALEYTIRFQNTGTDTAFNVIIRDSLNMHLDITTLELGTSSHDYELEITGNGFLNFNFINIMLPDSNVNQAGSNGFIKYKIRPFSDTPLKTQIKTDAAIYFDFNDPVITNETLHTIDLDFIEFGVWVADIPTADQAQVIIRPNPFRTYSTIEIKDYQANNYFFELFYFDGRLIRQESFASNQFLFEQKNLAKGIYLFRILDEKGIINTGKLIIQ